MDSITTRVELDTLAQRIKALDDQALAEARAALNHALEVGRLIAEAAKLVSKADWDAWVNEVRMDNVDDAYLLHAMLEAKIPRNSAVCEECGELLCPECGEHMEESDIIGSLLP